MLKPFPLTRSERFPRPRGFTIAEVIVSATLVVTMASVVVPLSLHNNRLWQQARYQKIAVEELSSQMEVLLSTDEAKLESAVEKLTPSAELQAIFPDASVRGDIAKDLDGTQITLRFSWAARQPVSTQEREPDSAKTSRKKMVSMPQRPVQLTAWYDVAASQIKSDKEPAETIRKTSREE